ncbi:ubiquitin carboxyl-terminal hydrolase 47 isoform X2 [Amia ocellicauda]|uniref:ubiquitin carboxyl-terminal hydrolase 47 isoform X2 n=1 Tax=Amia ocellicauda TaxID=2972642 RepID=UPI003464C669
MYSSWTSSARKGYNGLYNQGATCYLNTVLQTFFMDPKVRDTICSLPVEKEESISFQLKKLFKNLEEGQNTAETTGITTSLGITCVFEQQDAEEFFQRILNAVDSDVSKLYRGTLMNTTKCLGCEECNTDMSKFLDIPLPVDILHDSNEIYSVENGLEEFFRSSKLSGDNQLYCDRCNDKTDTETRTEVADMPHILTLHLKRFDYDYGQRSYVKINCPVEIPLTLHFEEEPRKYELYAVCRHIGSYRGGHYKAFIKSFEDDNWYSFNDSQVLKDGIDGSENIKQHNALFKVESQGYVFAAGKCEDYRGQSDSTAPGDYNNLTITENTHTQYIRCPDAYLVMYRLIMEEQDQEALNQSQQKADMQNSVSPDIEYPVGKEEKASNPLNKRQKKGARSKRNRNRKNKKSKKRRKKRK